MQDRQLRKAFGGRLSDEQRQALHHILGKDQLACVVGLAGAGKSTMLATAAEAWRRQEKNAVSRERSRDEALEVLVETYAMDAADNHSTRLAFAHRRKDVHALNQAIRATLRPVDDPPCEILLETETGKRAFSEGDRIVFGRNDKDLGVRNGMLGTVQCVSVSKISVMLDGDTPRRVSFDPRRYRSFDHGYAVTIHKSQGATVDQAYVLASRSMDHHLAYVAMTRHRDHLRLFVSNDDRPSWAITQRDLPFGQEKQQSRQRTGPSMG